mmetsp:Transcript_24770/g.33981  ORF Transcript_24770/g.33981 Transcript_24770/m.33981 type:complete len:120 (-) Transcript_24770:217-576(-)
MNIKRHKKWLNQAQPSRLGLSQWYYLLQWITPNGTLLYLLVRPMDFKTKGSSLKMTIFQTSPCLRAISLEVLNNSYDNGNHLQLNSADMEDSHVAIMLLLIDRTTSFHVASHVNEVQTP